MSRQICGSASKILSNITQRPQSVVIHKQYHVLSSTNHYNETGRKLSTNSSENPAYLLNVGQAHLRSMNDLLRHQNCRGNAMPSLTPTRSFSTKPLSDTGLELFVQGVQGDDCAQFLTWVWRCRKFGLENCDEQLEAIKTGKKTVGQVLEEQEKIIVSIAKKYKKEMELHEAESKDYVKGVQDGDDTSQYIQSFSPQGIQGDNCNQFKLWLEKCHQFGFRRCIERLSAIKAGDKSLEEIFAEHDALIEKIVKQQQDDENK